MDPIANYNPFNNYESLQNNHPKNSLVRQENVSISELRKVVTSEEKSTDVTIVTAEGDKVTLSASSLKETEFASYNYLGILEGQKTGIHVEEFTTYSNDKIFIKVEGELSAEELADIQAVMKKIEEIGDELFSGDIDGAVASALSLGSLGSLSSLQANLQYNYSTSMEYQKSINMTEVSSPELDGLENKRGFEKLKKIRKLLDRIFQTLDDAKVKPHKMSKKLPEYIDRLFNKLSKKHHFDETKHKLAKEIKSELMSRIKDNLGDHKLKEGHKGRYDKKRQDSKHHAV